jgi:hypothetical protein
MIYEISQKERKEIRCRQSKKASGWKKTDNVVFRKEKGIYNIPLNNTITLRFDSKEIVVFFTDDGKIKYFCEIDDDKFPYRFFIFIKNNNQITIYLILLM